MNFEFYTERKSNIVPCVTVCKASGRICFNVAAVRNFSIKQGQKVLLGYEKDTQTIGIKLIDSPTMGARKIRVHAKTILSADGTVNYSAYVNAKSFLQNFNIDFSATNKYQLSYDEENKILHFCLRHKFKF
jgi:hypothetical protein